MTDAASGRDLVALPRAAVLMLWTSAYLRGDLGPDDAARMSFGVGRSGPSGQGTDLFDWMTSLKRLPLAQLRLVLPVPGQRGVGIGLRQPGRAARSEAQARLVGLPRQRNPAAVPAGRCGSWCM